MVIVAIRRRRREPLIVVDERGVQENVVCYDDEGGGEEDTEAFDLLALRPLCKTGQSHQNQSRRVEHTSQPTSGSDWLFGQLVLECLQQADLDSAAPPYDSLQTYAFEGSASSAASLSSLNSLDSSNSQESQQSYEFLTEWGPRFSKLADLYGHREGGAVAFRLRQAGDPTRAGCGLDPGWSCSKEREEEEPHMFV